MNRKQKNVLIRILITAVLMIVLHFLPLEGWVSLVCYLVCYGIIGYDILKKAFRFRGKETFFDENFLMAIASVGAILLQQYVEGCAVVLFYQIGELFQSYAVGKSRRNITDLMDIRPDYANVEVDGKLSKVDPDEVDIGTVIVVKPGEKVPIDGILFQGETNLDTMALTGESYPRSVKEGDEILSGSINLTGTIQVKTTKEFGESTVSRILDLVENSSNKKAKAEAFISKFAKYYTPAVCYLALALAIIPPIVQFLVFKQSPTFDVWIYRALTFLVISCPCALVISIPLSFFAGIGCASREGILIKGANYIETLSKVKRVVFDKTGTLTEGVFEVVGIHHNKMDGDKILELAAHVEAYSNHPISHSLRKAYGKQPDLSRVSDVQEISGNGLSGLVDGVRVLVGNDKLMKNMGYDYLECHGVGTIVHVVIDGTYQGHILIRDIIKEKSSSAIRMLKKLGVQDTRMLTGDAKSVAEYVAGKLGLKEYYSELLPEDKVTKVEAFLEEEKEGEYLAFVGDGINDAPVITRADVGFAMGGAGADAAIEAADVVVMDDNPEKIPIAIGLSQICMRIVYENIVFSIGVKLICLILGALGVVNMWIAIFADVGVMVIAVLNAVRILFMRRLIKE